jgi:chromosome partitioning protein
MAIVLTVAQQKGGAGKTTLAANLAVALRGMHRVALLDVDPQRSLARWHALRTARLKDAADLTFAEVSGWRLPAALDRLKRDHDILLVDSPPQIEADARTAVRAADLVLVPIQPSAPDLWAAEGTLRLASDNRRPARLVLNRVPGGARALDRVAPLLAEQRVPALTQHLGNRIAFAHAFAEGSGVTETQPRSVASAEIRALADAILKAAQAT